MIASSSLTMFQTVVMLPVDGKSYSAGSFQHCEQVPPQSSPCATLLHPGKVFVVFCDPTMLNAQSFIN